MGSQLDTTNQQDLLHGSAQSIADYLGIDVRQARRYKAGHPLPGPALKLLQLRAGDLAGLLGQAWEGFSFNRAGELFMPGWANGFSPEKIKAMFFVLQEAAALRADVKQLRGEIWAMQQVRRSLKRAQDPVSKQAQPDRAGRDQA